MAIPNERQEVMDMPAAYAHYVFGKKVFQELSGTEKEIIRKGEDAFLLGLHGPDLLIGKKAVQGRSRFGIAGVFIWILVSLYSGQRVSSIHFGIYGRA